LLLLGAAAGLALLVLACATKTRMDATAGARLVQGADYVGKRACAMCHPERVAGFDRALHSGIRTPTGRKSEIDTICESCHGPGSLHLEAGGGRDTYIADPTETPRACFQCHRSVQTRFFQKHRHPVRQGKVSCSDCHDPHGADIHSPAGTRMSREQAVCRQCHREQAEPRVFEHEALREGCTSCHNPHGSINQKLLVQRDNNLCLRCHGQIGSAGSVRMGDFPHTTRLARGVCWSSGCHTAVHGSNINPHLRY
jgi:predicted CXXCH cytochrome family protein